MKRFVVLTTLGSLVLASCSSLKYDDPGKQETVTIAYGSTDLQSLSAEMVESLVAAPSLNYLENPGKGDDLRVITVFGGIENRTTEHIDTGGISDKIQTSLIKSGKFRFVASDQGRAEIEDEVRYQQSGRVRDDMMREFGKQLGADVVLYGALRSIKKRAGATIETAGVRTDDVYYQFVLKCVNVDTAEIIWQDEAELRKTERRGIFGRI